MKPKYRFANLRNRTLLASTSMVVCLSGVSFAQTSVTWNGSTSSDWNTAANWDGGVVPTKTPGNQHAVVNTNSPNIATISADIVSPVDIFVGTGATARLDHTAGVASTGNGNWMFIGHNGGTGTLNVANTAGTGGTYTGYGQGTGSMTSSGRLYIGGQTGSGSTGTVNIHTTGTFTVGNHVEIGTNTSTGTLNIDSGTLNMGVAGGSSWFEIGNGGGCSGTLNLSSGTINKNGGDHFIVGANGSTGVLNMTGGAINVNNEFWVANNANSNGTLNLSAGTITNNSWAAVGRASNTNQGTVNHSGGTWNKTGGGRFLIGDGGKGTYNLSGTGVLTSTDTFVVGNNSTPGGTLNMTGGSITVTGEVWFGQGGSSVGTVTMSAGTISNTSWVAIGREGGTGTFNMTGGTWTKTGNSQFIVGASGPGTMTQSAGLVDIQQGYTWVGEGGGASTATFTISGTAEFRSSLISVGPESPNATLNLDGGTVRTRKFLGSRDENGGATSGTGTVNFNGSQIIATANNTDFIATSLDNAVIGTGGLLVDSNSFTLGAPKGLSGTGGVVKSGAGKLSLTGLNSYSGNNTVNAGELVLSSSGSGTGSITVADGAALGVSASVFVADQLQTTSASFGTTAAGTSLNLNIGNVAGSNPSTSIFDVTGNLSLAGDVVVNVSGSQFQAANMPLVTYNAATRTGTGVFTLGTLPNGVVATIVDDPNFYGPNQGLVYLNITSVALPKWDGSDAVKYNKIADLNIGTFDVTVTDANHIAIGQKAVGAGIPLGATVTNIAGNVITLDQAATATSIGSSVIFTAATGSNDGVWDINTTQNWVDQVTAANSVYKDPNPVLFDDTATGPTTVTLNATANPSEVVFNNSSLAYTLTGTGKVSGTSTFTKSGTAALTVSTTNDYTGVTTLAGGTTSVAAVSNGGFASPLGAATSDAANLVLSGGTLDYTGATASTDRGFTIGAVDSAISLPALTELTVSGVVTSNPTTSFNLKGAGTLTLTNNSIMMGANGQPNEIMGGTLKLSGSGTQVVSMPELWLGTPGSSGNLILDQTTLNVGSWMAIARNAGDLITCSVTATNSTVTTGGFSTGYNNGSPNNNGDQFVTLTNTTWTNNGDMNFAESLDATSLMTLAGTSSFTCSNRVLMGQGQNSVGSLVVQDTASFNKTGGWLSIGQGNNGIGNVLVKDNGTFTANGDFNISDTGSSQGTLTVQGNGTVNATGIVFVGKGRPEGDWPCVGTLNVDGGTFNSVTYITVGRRKGATGTLNITGGLVHQTDAGAGIAIGENGTGTLNISGGTLQVDGGGLYLTAETVGTGNGTANLNGGTIIAKRVVERDFAVGNISAFHFNGGTLKANTGAAYDFMTGLDNAVVDAGGAFIDTNGQTIAIAQVLNDGGGNLTKQGAGTLYLNGSNSYLGSTTVVAGTLGGTGSIDGPLQVDASAAVNPGTSVGTFTTNDAATIDGTYVCELDGGTADQLTVAGALTINTGAVLDFNEISAPAGPALVIATYDTLSGTFTTVNDLPAGYTLDYNYNGLKQIALVQTATPYTTWINGYTSIPVVDRDPGDDPDGDGVSNVAEFALNADPSSGASTGKMVGKVASVGGSPTLVLTLPVRTGATFSGATEQVSALIDGLIYRIQGSDELTTWNLAVSEVLGGDKTTIETGLPALDTGWEYRTFQSPGVVSGDPKDFLRAVIEAP